MKTEWIDIIPILPSSDVERDVKWFEEHLGFTTVSHTKNYAIIRVNNLYLHLQWYQEVADKLYINKTAIKIFVKNIEPIFKKCVDKGLVTAQKLRLKTPWNTNEFGFYDLNQNAIVVAEDLR